MAVSLVKPTVVARMAQALKAEMQEHGIFRSSFGFPEHVKSENYNIHDYTGSVCLIANRTTLAVERTDDWTASYDFQAAVLEKIIEADGPDTVVEWLNQATDDEVYALLDSIA